MTDDLKSLCKLYNVPRETLQSINRYIDLLIFWNKRMNLTSRRSTRADIIMHIQDSFFAAYYINDLDKRIVDIGSGAGFLGIVFSMLGYKNCTLVEKNENKSIFLKYIIAEHGLSADIRNQCASTINDINADYIVARAVTNLSQLFAITSGFICYNSKYIVHVGGEYMDQINLLKEKYSFDFYDHEHPKKSFCRILEIYNIKARS